MTDAAILPSSLKRKTPMRSETVDQDDIKTSLLEDEVIAELKVLIVLIYHIYFQYLLYYINSIFHDDKCTPHIADPLILDPVFHIVSLYVCMNTTVCV